MWIIFKNYNRDMCILQLELYFSLVRAYNTSDCFAKVLHGKKLTTISAGKSAYRPLVAIRNLNQMT